MPCNGIIIIRQARIQMDWMRSLLMNQRESFEPKSRWIMKNEPSIGWRCRPKTRVGRPKKVSASFKSKCWISTTTARRFPHRPSPSRWVTSIPTSVSEYIFFVIGRFACFKHSPQQHMKKSRINIDIN